MSRYADGEGALWNIDLSGPSSVPEKKDYCQCCGDFSVLQVWSLLEEQLVLYCLSYGDG